MSIRKIAFSLALIAGSLVACEAPEDFFEPRNPDLAVDAVLGTVSSSTRLLNGCERQLAFAYQEILPIAEIASDNYQNTQTFFNQFLDALNIDFTDNDLNDTAFDIQRLRALANLGINDIGPGDETTTADQTASFYFFRGISQLLAGSYFRSIPVEANGALGSQSDLYALAIADFDTALGQATEAATINSILLARARAKRAAGDCTGAVADAQTLLSNDGAFVRYVMFDAINGPENILQNALFDRGTFDDLQPLPTLDFLDPKYNNIIDPTTDFNVPYLKAEEAHLIIAEGHLASGDVGSAKTVMTNLVALVDSRETATFSDANEQRSQVAPGSRPDTTSVVVSAGPNRPFRSGLVLDRNNGDDVTIPVISGTSVRGTYLNDLTGVEATLEALYLMRQEIFIAEGRRVIDLGIAFVPSENELLLNDNVNMEDVQPILPSFIEANQANMDAFTYDAATGEATVTVNFNELIVQNRTSEFVAPCF